MHIQSSNMALSGYREAFQQQAARPRPMPANPQINSSQQETLDLSEQPAAEAQDLDQQMRQQLEGDPLWGLVKALLLKLTGRDLQTEDIVPSAASRPSPQEEGSAQPQTWGIQLAEVQTLVDREHTQVQAEGTAITSDGRTLQIAVALDLFREYRETRMVEVNAPPPAGVRKDPLVINYASPSASLSEHKIELDLDLDGQKERVSFVGSGSAFLALDGNQNGQVDDGSELFGAQSGDGFADLLHFDEDGNGWIDEGDAVWGQLKLWLRDEQGQPQLINLAKMGMGAIYLGSTASQFNLNTAQNQELGQIKRTGVFLFEDGRVGTAQQVDLTV